MSDTRLQPGDDSHVRRAHCQDRRRRQEARDRRRQRRQPACIVDQEHPVEACVGDWVLIHVGFAMSRIDEAEAAETLNILTELGEAQKELDAMRRSAAK